MPIDDSSKNLSDSGLTKSEFVRRVGFLRRGESFDAGDVDENVFERLCDQHIRQAISTCWMMLPEEKKNSEAVAIEIRRIVERALTSLKEDAAAFGFTK